MNSVFFFAAKINEDNYPKISSQCQKLINDDEKNHIKMVITCCVCVYFWFNRKKVPITSGLQLYHVYRKSWKMTKLK